MLSAQGFGLRLRLCSPIPFLARNLVSKVVKKQIPTPKEPIATPQDFLKAIGRASETKLSIERWEDFWKISGYDLRGAGLAVRDRRYILWCMEKFRQGQSVKNFAHEAPPKKIIRGRGPAVQNGKRIRSKRLK